MNLTIFKDNRLIGIKFIEEWRELYFYNPLRDNILFIDFFDFTLFKKFPVNSFSIYILSKVCPSYGYLLDIFKPISFCLHQIQNRLKTLEIDKLNINVKDFSQTVSILKDQVIRINSTSFPIIKEKSIDPDKLLQNNYMNLKNELFLLETKLKEEIVYDKKEALKKQINTFECEKKLVEETLIIEKRKPQFHIEYTKISLDFLLDYLNSVENELIKVQDCLEQKKYFINIYDNLISRMQELEKNLGELSIRIPFNLDMPKPLVKQIITEDTLPNITFEICSLFKKVLGIENLQIVFNDLPFDLSYSNLFFIRR